LSAEFPDQTRVVIIGGGAIGYRFTKQRLSTRKDNLSVATQRIRR